MSELQSHSLTDYRDSQGNRLSVGELRKILKRNSSIQFNWWRAKSKFRVGRGNPPRGVRENKDIRDL